MKTNITQENKDKIADMLEANNEVYYHVIVGEDLPPGFCFEGGEEKKFLAGGPAWITRWDNTDSAVLCPPAPTNQH